ncbi:sn-glycerol-3-phosphate ABC transporter ATP-binding protein UgpC [Mumia sp.]|uniref:ABC transporter ATP-binding protein n=1 Tax=Mumia sp. TaxID=1965300 RepID=UPI00262F2147|nr:sn-glycerol-3-phosphate ABC transporter ATP-binding protein UgpC [Mumia sp.]MDD9349921.1 sn-glycerol-3-phosphate ABC transporter ATP-binding protein UgpC [Mumia sp.]
MATIEMKNIVKQYGDNAPAVNDVSLEVADGEFMILVGPSGCGKSTLLRMIVGLEEITSGDMMIGGRRVNDEPPRDRNLAMVFQNYALYPHLNVYENIAFPLRLQKGMKDEEIDKRVRDAAETLELTEFLDRKPANMSGGQRQRVAMGRAIVREAQAFLFDEPLSNLDAKLRGQMRTEIARLQRKLGVTTVYVTHDQTEAMTLGDRVALLKKGVLQQVASPRELYEDPVNLFVAGFIGSPPMNMLPARPNGDQLELPFVSFTMPPEMAKAAEGHELLIAGARPEHFTDANGPQVPEASVPFSATVDVVEWLGNEQYAYIPFEAPSEVRSTLDQLAKDLDGERMQQQIVVTLDPTTRVREGDEAQLTIDVSKLHLFDPETGDNLMLSARAGAHTSSDADGSSGAATGGAHAAESVARE